MKETRINAANYANVREGVKNSRQFVQFAAKRGGLRTVYKPHSVRPIAWPVRSSLWAVRRRAARCGLPGTDFLTAWGSTYEDEPSPVVRGQLRPCLALLPTGVTWPSTLLQMPVVFYTTFSPSPLTSREVSWLFVSVALIRQVSSSRRVPRPGCYPTSCSMECGLSSIPTTQDRDRPTDLRRHHDTRKEGESQLWRLLYNKMQIKGDSH
jgi:hypothetical protein